MALSSLLDSLPPLPKWRLWTRESDEEIPVTPALPLAKARRNGIKISLEDRWIVLGTTGSGKTYFSRELLSQYHRLYPKVPLYILDTKAVGDFDEWYDGLVMTDSPPPPITSGIQVWQPGTDNQDAYEAWFETLLHAPGPLGLLIDELSSIGKGKGNDAPLSFQRLLKQGRAMGKMLINCSQEMAYIPKQTKTQTTHVVRFRMNQTGYDNQNANKLIGRDAHGPEPKSKYGFHYRRVDDSTFPVLEYSTCHDFF